MTKIGIFSGTFDPIHVGHLDFCRAAIEACGLDMVVLLPEAQPRGKSTVAPIDQRIAMIKLAIESDRRLGVLSLKSSPFTIDRTLPELRQVFPKDQLTLLIGSDIARTLAHRWPKLEALLDDMCLAIGLRRGDDPKAIDELMRQLEKLHGHAPQYTCLPSPSPGTASAQVRSGNHLPDDLDPKVAAYIAKHKLYE